MLATALVLEAADGSDVHAIVGIDHCLMWNEDMEVLQTAVCKATGLASEQLHIAFSHTHGDHVSGNVEFPATVEVIVQENTKVNMEKMPIFKESNGVGLPKKTFKDKMTIGKGADQIDMYYFGRGHTNGDAWIVFPAHRIVHSGDIFAGKSSPELRAAWCASRMRQTCGACWRTRSSAGRPSSCWAAAAT